MLLCTSGWNRGGVMQAACHNFFEMASPTIGELKMQYALNAVIARTGTVRRRLHYSA
jgi:hypothetical protein